MPCDSVSDQCLLLIAVPFRLWALPIFAVALRIHPLTAMPFLSSSVQCRCLSLPFDAIATLFRANLRRCLACIAGRRLAFPLPLSSLRFDAFPSHLIADLRRCVATSCPALPCRLCSLPLLSLLFRLSAAPLLAIPSRISAFLSHAFALLSTHCISIAFRLLCHALPFRCVSRPCPAVAMPASACTLPNASLRRTGSSLPPGS